MDEALAFIERHGSRHTEAIVTADRAAAERFLTAVDAGSVFHNASNRFADGFRYGLGAEVGVSTDKLHARGPVGVEGLLTYRWLLRGDGQVTDGYGPGGRRYTHRDLIATQSGLRTNDVSLDCRGRARERAAMRDQGRPRSPLINPAPADGGEGP